MIWCTGMLPRLDAVAIPGLVDCHTHPAFGGDRVEDGDVRAAHALGRLLQPTNADPRL